MDWPPTQHSVPHKKNVYKKKGRGHALMLIVYTQGQVKQAGEGEVITH